MFRHLPIVYNRVFQSDRIIYLRKLLTFLMILIIHREVDIFKDHVWNSQWIWVQKDTQVPNGAPNHIYDFPEKYDLQNKSNIIFLSKGCLLIECSCHQFHVSAFFSQKQH